VGKNKIYIVAQTLSAVVGLIVNLLSNKLLLPEEVGVIQGAMVVITYFNFAGFGFYCGLTRFLASHQCATDGWRDKVKKNSAFFTRYSSVLIVLAFLFLSFFGHSKYGLNVLTIPATIYVLIHLFTIQFKSNDEAIMRAECRFQELGWIVIKENLVYLLFSLIIIPIGLLGRFLNDSVRCIYGFYLRYHSQGRLIGDKKLKPDFNMMLSILKEGFPLIINDYIWGVFIVIEIMVASMRFSLKDLGYLTIGKYLSTLLVFIPNTIATIYYPQILQGVAKQESRSKMLGYWIRITFYPFIINLILVAFLSVFMNKLVLIHLPDYAPGIELSKYNALALLILSLSGNVVFISAFNCSFRYLILFGLLTAFVIFFANNQTQIIVDLKGVLILKIIAAGIYTIGLSVFTLVKIREKHNTG
jgi:O-antigen/teichoic acid export membrane protein